jgi:hypothetical protein
MDTKPTDAERIAACLAFFELPADTRTEVDGGVAIFTTSNPSGHWSWVISLDELKEAPDLEEALDIKPDDLFVHGGRRWVIFPY